ncbi:MAG: ATP-binding protein, partial [Anaerolineales bacterium]|nr:ATP-binding protein [Anaerolineales bacterium]
MAEGIQSLTELLERASAKRFLDAPPPEDLGLAEKLNFPFLAMVGQEEMKLALMLSLINPNIGGSLLIGPRGTGKTTAVRSLSDLMPDVERSRCPYGCIPADIEAGGMDAVCPDCAKRYAEDEPLTYTDRVRLIELPLNAKLEDVVGGLDERAAVHQRVRLKRGLLAHADQNILYVDEVNLLPDEIVDAILDAAAQGTYSVHRGAMAATYRARFVLVGSMNPEEGRLRPQILDRFGLRVIVRGLDSTEHRMEAYQRAVAFRNNPRRVIQSYEDATVTAREELTQAREDLPEVEISEETERFGLRLIEDMGIDSLRAEITLFEAARAYTVADGRDSTTPDDVRAVAPMALRLRRSEFMDDFFREREAEDEELQELL